MKIINLIVLTLAFTFTGFAQNYSGKFSRSDQNGKGEVRVSNVWLNKKKLLKFSFVATGKQKGTCVGEISGFAKWINSKTAEYNSNGNERDPETKELIPCRLTLIFLSANRLKVVDKNCDDFHGAACTFEGTYRKK